MKNVVYEHAFGHFFADEPGGLGNLVAVCGGEEAAAMIVSSLNRPGISDAQPRDVYVGPDGRTWRVEWRCDSPTIGVVQLDGKRVGPANEMSGGIGGLMWQGFKRIYRPEEK